jgi:hypothetical protein
MEPDDDWKYMAIPTAIVAVVVAAAAALLLTVLVRTFS